MLKNYKELKVWQTSYNLCLNIYKSTAEYVRSLYIAYGSVCELETQAMISGDMGYVKRKIFQKLRDKIPDVERMLKALIKSFENKRLNP
jgi:hypothetical protein